MAGHLLVQLSDIHLSAQGTISAGGRPRDNLVRALGLLGEALRPELLVLSGDLADAGEAPCYKDLADLVGEAADGLGAQVVYLPGNHDERGAFRRHLLGEEGGGPINQVRWSNGLRVVALDSTVPGHDHGELAPETLAFLEEALAEPAPDGTVVALHHPPVPTPIAPMARVALAEPERLGTVLAGSDVRLVVCGHNHHEMAGTLAGTPVWVSPAAAYRADAASTAVFRPMPGGAFTRVDLHDGAGATATVIQIPPG